MNVKKKHVNKDLVWKIVGAIAFVLITLMFFCDIIYIGNIKKHGIKLNAYVENIDMDGLSGSGDDSGIYADIAYVYQGVKYQTRTNKGLDISISSGKKHCCIHRPQRSWAYSFRIFWSNVGSYNDFLWRLFCSSGQWCR